MQRTIRLRLDPSPDQSDALAETSRQFTDAFNMAARIGWEANVGNATKLHYLVYYPTKVECPGLVSDFLIQARIKAAEALRSAFKLREDPDRTVSCPRSDACPPRYNLHTYKLDWQSRTVRVSTANGRQTIRFDIPEYAAKYAGFPVDTADLIHKPNGWWLHVVVTVPAPNVEPTYTVIGVDLGLAQPAVTSNNRFLGSRAWKATEGRYFKHQRALQSKGTKSAKRRLRKMRGRQARFRRQCDHILSKQIVAQAEPGGTIALENLTNIRKRVKTRHGKPARKIHGWSFDQVKQFVEYKAEEHGCTVVLVDPRHTSQCCSRCGHTARNNRRSRGHFCCRKCGFDLHADPNAARNIAAKYRAGRGTSPTSGPPPTGLSSRVNTPVLAPGTSPRL